MRILNVTAQKPDSTGSGVYLAHTVAAQTAAGHEVAVVCGVSAADDPAASLPVGTRLFPVRFETEELPFPVCGMSDEMPYASTRYRDLAPSMLVAFERAFAGAIDRAVAEFRPDAVVCHHLYLVAALARERIADVPVGVVCHGTDLRQMAAHGLERDRICSAMRGMDAVFALHSSQAAAICSCYGVDHSKISVVGTGYDRAVFHLDASVRRRPGSIVYVGKISFKKGVESLVGAVDALGPGEPAPTLTLVGGHDPAAADYGRIVERARACRWDVDFLGRVPTERVANAYRAHEVFVLPSFYEGLPLVGIEALACGCKVVMTDLPGVRAGMEELLPGNPIRWVEPPPIRGVDDPVEEELPAFEERLSHAIARALAEEEEPFPTEGASWDVVAGRMLTALRTG